MLRALVSRPDLEKMASEQQKVGKIELKRELGLFSAVSIILAVMIGETRLLLRIYLPTDTRII